MTIPQYVWGAYQKRPPYFPRKNNFERTQNS